MLDALDVGLVLIDRAGAIVYANRAALDVLQIDAPVGRDAATWLGLPARLEDELPDGGPMEIEITHETPDGVPLDLEMTLGLTGNAAWFFCAFRDVHEAKRREEARRRFDHLAAMGTMVAGFAHEVRNPVAALRSITEELVEDLASAGVALSHPGRLLRVLERIERLVRTSLQFGRPAAPKRGAHRPWTICSVAIGGVAPRTMAAGQPIRVEIEQDLPDVFVDHEQFVQALVVLLDNALDAASSPRGVLLRVSKGRPSREADGRARRSTAPPPPQVMIRFEVIDDGPGVPVAETTRIFDPFFTTKPSGTGLGLSIAQQVVSENGGRLELTSARSPTVFSALAPTVDEPD